VGNSIQLGGGAVLQAGPALVDDTGSFPGGASSVPLSLLPSFKGYVVSSGVLFQNINVASPSFQALPGVGASSAVTRAHTVYARSTANMVLRLTYAGDAVTKLLYLYGMWLQETPTGSEITLVEAQGVGSLEFLAVGNS
jgi:hypothetical protein